MEEAETERAMRRLWVGLRFIAGYAPGADEPSTQLTAGAAQRCAQALLADPKCWPRGVPGA